ncbi:MAG: AMP-binding protein [Cyanobacteriota bacterium]|nr:AMP-binding protein [Cyanobacteriota bacterium]MDY6358650.1 AMP-binding protein [Cyanobacteriota bacterium]MDY6363695.1 AMP-binding protein [Cyanobacteriota bacterium]MDY6383584.1 AMP-binding protein [Cyanobacteriota bacterium]
MAQKYENIFSLLEKTTTLNQKKVALGMKTLWGWNELTYKGVSLLSERLAAHLINDLQIPKGEKLAILSESLPEYGVCVFGSVLAGLTVVPLDNKLTIYELTSILSSCEPTVLMTSTKNYKKAQQLKDKIPSIKYIILMEASEYESKETPSLYSIPANYSAKWRRRPLHDTAFIIYTSGTTGAPKGVQTTYKNMLAQMYDMRETMRHMIPKNKNVRLLSILPMNHLFELTVGFFTMLNHGYSIYYSSSLKPKDILDIMQEKHIRFMVTVPAFLKLLKSYFESEIHKKSTLYKVMFKIKYQIARFMPFNIRRMMFRTIHRLYGKEFFGYISGGAPLDPVVGAWFKRIGVRIFQGYGLSETSPVVSMCNTPNQDNIHSVGPILSSYEAKIDPETGELLVKGPSVMKGYYGRQDLTDEVLEPDGWFHTGDIGEIRNGLLYITGRIKNLIVLSGGKKVFPEEVETVLQQSNNFAEVCVVGMPRVGGGKDGCEEIVAVIVPTDDYTQNFNSFEELEKAVVSEVKQLSTQLAPYKRPINIVVRTQHLPRTATSKIKRKEVKALVSGVVK